MRVSTWSSPLPLTSHILTLACSLFLLLGTMLALPSAVAASPSTLAVAGEFRTQIQPPSACPPPSTLCAVGIATGDIEGSTEVVITSSQVVFGEDGFPYSAYTGTITISAPKGELIGTVSGRVRLTDGQLRSTVTFTEGTQGYHKTTGELQVTGTINLATGVEVDSYTGVLIKD